MPGIKVRPPNRASSDSLDLNPDEEVGGAAGAGEPVGRDLVTVPLNRGISVLLKAGKRTSADRPAFTPSMSDGSDLGLDHQLVVPGHDVQDQAAGRDHAADRVRDHVHDHARYRRAHVEPRVLVLNCPHPFEQLVVLLLGLIQLILDLLDEVLVDLTVFQLVTLDQDLGFLDLRLQISVFALELLHGSLRGGDPPLGGVALGPERPLIASSLAISAISRCLTASWRSRPSSRWRLCASRLAFERLFALQRVAPRLEDPLLARQDLGGGGVGLGLGDEILGEDDLIEPVTLGAQPRLLGLVGRRASVGARPARPGRWRRPAGAEPGPPRPGRRRAPGSRG